MTMTASLLLDLVMGIVLVCSLVKGFRRGGILTLCSLLAVVLGVVGGCYLAVHYEAQVLALLSGTLPQEAAPLAVQILLFLAGFVGAQLIWTLLCHALHLVAKLPVLHLLNKLLGGLLGLIKGAILLGVALWLLSGLLGWIPPEVLDGSYLLTFLSKYAPPTAPFLVSFPDIHTQFTISCYHGWKMNRPK